MEFLVDAETVGKAIGVSDRSVRRLVKDGVINKVKNGQYDLIECCNLYINHIKEKQTLLDKDTDKLEQELLIEKVLYERFRKRKLEIIVSEMENNMHDARDIEQLWNNTIIAFKSRIRGLATKISPRVQFTDDLAEITEIIRKEVDEALRELSNYDAEKFNKREQYVTEDKEDNDTE